MIAYREVILDIETTGLRADKGHRLIEIGMVEMINKTITGAQFHSYVNPRRNVPQQAVDIHGITTAFLEDKPFFADIVNSFLDFIGDSKLVIHNAKFDISFINYELKLLNKPLIQINVSIDTLKISRALFYKESVTLDALCKRFNITTERKFHGALIDAKILAKAYLELTRFLLLLLE